MNEERLASRGTEDANAVCERLHHSKLGCNADRFENKGFKGIATVHNTDYNHYVTGRRSDATRFEPM